MRVRRRADRCNTLWEGREEHQNRHSPLSSSHCHLLSIFVSRYCPYLYDLRSHHYDEKTDTSLNTFRLTRRPRSRLQDCAAGLLSFPL